MPKSKIDTRIETLTRALASCSSRRSFLSRFGILLTGAALLPVLPVDRSRASESEIAAAGQPRTYPPHSFAATAQTTDETKCNYWRYCGLGGHLCACCGGSANACPPGSVASATSWIGTCINPDSGEAALIAYRDCCGKEVCGRCICGNEENASQIYFPQANSDIDWCFGTDQMIYHCTHSDMLGKA
jgi:methylamine dehydrogenase light chain